MDEATKQALGEFVQKMLSAVERSADWTSQQAPLVVQEWLRWQMAEALLWAAFQIAVAITIPLMVHRIILAITEGDKYAASGARIGRMVASGITLVVFGIPATFNLLVALQVYLAPRVVVLEKFAQLVK